MKMQMELSAVKPLVGREARSRLSEGMSILENTNFPIFLTGPSGSGKTAMAMALAKKYATDNDVPAYYVQLSPDQTKTSLILGLRLIKGTLKPAKGVVAEAMESGGIVVIDEATHGTQELLLMFNSVLDRVSITSIGDQVVYALPSFRVIFCSNPSTYAGNVRLPQSFAQRLITMKFDYPSLRDEMRIASQIANDEFAGEVDAPKEILQFVTEFVRETRSDVMPLSARNIASAIIRMSIAPKSETSNLLDSYFTGGNAEVIRRSVANRIMGEKQRTVASVMGDDVNAVLHYVSRIGVERFRSIILDSIMFHLDVDGMEVQSSEIRTKIENGII